MVALLLPVVVDVGGNGSAARRSADVHVCFPHPELFRGPEKLESRKIEKASSLACIMQEGAKDPD